MLDQEKILKAAADAAMQHQQQGMQQVIPPQPAPMSVQLSTTQDTQGNKLVVLIIHHAMGSSVFHFDPNGADQIGDGLKDAARLARTGLELAR